MKMRCSTVEKRAHIVGMHQGGAKGVEIVAALGHSKSTVSIVLKEFELCGSVEHLKWTRCLQTENYQSGVLGL
jgi:predicted transcriptional regulator